MVLAVGYRQLLGIGGMLRRGNFTAPNWRFWRQKLVVKNSLVHFIRAPMRPNGWHTFALMAARMRLVFLI